MLVFLSNLAWDSATIFLVRSWDYPRMLVVRKMPGFFCDIFEQILRGSQVCYLYYILSNLGFP